MSRARGGGWRFVDRAGDGDVRYWNQPGSAKFTIANGDFSTERILLAQ